MTATTFTRTPMRVSHRSRRLLMAVAEHAVAISVAIAVIFPFIVVVTTAVMSQRQASKGEVLPNQLVWHNFIDVFHDMAFARDLWNTVLYATLSSAGVLISAIPVAYALSHLQWRGRNAVFILVLATMMIPDQITSLPLYVLYSNFGWIGTLKPLILPTFFFDAYSIFLLRQFFMTVPQEITEAARIDGASQWQILTRVMLPMVKPALAAVGLFQFLFAWNDFYNPLLYTGNNPHGQTLAVAISQLGSNGHIASYQLEMAAALMFLLPVVVIFFFAQKIFVEGINLTGVKG
jgi:multiple sugar transport system permease protein